MQGRHSITAKALPERMDRKITKPLGAVRGYSPSAPAGVRLTEERQLLERVAEGDWDAYTHLFNHYLPKLTHYIFPLTGNAKADTEDIIQDIFLLIWEKKEVLIAVRYFDQYLFRTAKNKFIDQLRRQKAVNKIHVNYERLQSGYHLHPESSLQCTEYTAIAAEGIDRLSDKLRKVFILSTQEELSLAEIAEELGLPKETVKKRLYLATRSVKEYLQKHAGWTLLLCWTIFQACRELYI